LDSVTTFGNDPAAIKDHQSKGTFTRTDLARHGASRRRAAPHAHALVQCHDKIAEFAPAPAIHDEYILALRKIRLDLRLLLY